MGIGEHNHVGGATPETAGGVEASVQDTAYLAAAFRAAETRRPRPRMTDPFAELFLRARGRGVRGHHELVAAGGDAVVERARLVDELLADTVTHVSGGEALVVNLGAGLCSRPYRMDLAGCALVVEFDDPRILSAKAEVLNGYEPSCPVRRVGLDLRDAELLPRYLAALNAIERPVVVLTEGLLPYMSTHEIETLSWTLADALSDAVWLTDVVSSSSGLAMQQLARGSGSDIDIHGIDTLESLEAGRWTSVDYRLLPAAPHPVPNGRAAGRASSRTVVDGVVKL